MSGVHARYSRVLRRLWIDDGFRNLSAAPPNGQTLWLRLLTGTELTNIPGVIPVWEAGMAQALRWPIEGFREAFREVSEEGMAEADWDAGLVWVPKAISHNKPESPNVIRSWGSTWDLVPECELKVKIYLQLRAYVASLPDGFVKAFRQAIADPSRNQEQEQEQEQEIPPSPPSAAWPPSANFVSMERVDWIEAYRAAIVDRGGKSGWIFPTSEWSDLKSAVVARCDGDDRKNIVGWVAREVGRFLAWHAALEPGEAKFWPTVGPRSFVRWLNMPESQPQPRRAKYDRVIHLGFALGPDGLPLDPNETEAYLAAKAAAPTYRSTGPEGGR